MKFWSIFIKRVFLIWYAAMAMAAVGMAAKAQTPQPRYYPEAMNAADFILNLQDDEGAIPDRPGGEKVNEDSNMEYALSGLAAAYDASGMPCYLDGLEKGIRWLAAREEMADPDWRGSWFYAYSSSPPYEPLAIHMGNNIINVRGVDATSGLFVYLLLKYQMLSGSDALTVEFEDNARAALDFLLAHNSDPSGFFCSSWQLHSDDGTWHLWQYKYSADQADVFLGLRAGFILYADPNYGEAADFLAKNVSSAFFLDRKGRYALGMDANGALDKDFEGFNGIFPQGYLPWVFGPGDNNTRSRHWLIKHRRTSGAVVVKQGPAYSLSADVMIMASTALGKKVPGRSERWIAKKMCDSIDGGVVDSNRSKVKYTNVAGFTIISLLYEPYLSQQAHD